jgi:hypothetical protein
MKIIDTSIITMQIIAKNIKNPNSIQPILDSLPVKTAHIKANINNRIKKILTYQVKQSA